MQEIWKDIKGYEDKYQISNLGNIKTIKEWAGNKYSSKYKKCNKLIKPIKDSGGYYCVFLWKNSKGKTHRIHRLVAETFIPNPEKLPCINHKDGNKQNNCINNLEWCTYKYNSNEAIRLGLSNPIEGKNLKRWNGKFGKEHNKSKKIRQINKETNKTIAIFDSINDAYRKTGISPSNISTCCRKQINFKNGKSWICRTAGGYKWEFI